MSSTKENTRMCCLCGSSPHKDPSITLHRFPKPGSKNALRCELWSKYCFPNEAWSSPKFQDELHSKHKMLCSKHFKSTCFYEKKLFRTAVLDVEWDTTISNLSDQPAIFEPIASSSGIYPLREHNANVTQKTVPSHASVNTPTNSMFLCKTSKKEGDQKSKMLIKKLKNSMNKVYRLQKTVKHLQNEAFLNVICNNETVKKIFEKKISSTFALLLQGELQNYKRKKHGRRWNMEAKIIALRLYKRSPTSYKLLRRLICLPAPSTLKSLLSKFKMNVGTNKTILTVLKNSIKHYGPSEREFILLWDENWLLD